MDDNTMEVGRFDEMQLRSDQLMEDLCIPLDK